MKWPWTARSEKLDRRTREAQGEARRSQELLDRDRREIIGPMKKTASKNHFSALIREALIEGYDRNGRSHGRGEPV